jgi:membrane-associated protein
MMNEIQNIFFDGNLSLNALVSNNVLEAYLLLFFIIFLETGFIVFPFLPGDGLIFSAGVITASTELSILILMPLLILAAVLGNHFNYSVGKQIGYKIEHSKNKFAQRYLVKSIIKTHNFYQKHGKKSIIIGRFFPVIRTYIPFLAGTVNFDFSVFSTYTLIGSAIWVSLFALSGYFLGEIPWMKDHFGIVFIGLMITTLIPFFYTASKSLFIKVRN